MREQDKNYLKIDVRIPKLWKTAVYNIQFYLLFLIANAGYSIFFYETKKYAFMNNTYPILFDLDKSTLTAKNKHTTTT